MRGGVRRARRMGARRFSRREGCGPDVRPHVRCRMQARATRATPGWRVRRDGMGPRNRDRSCDAHLVRFVVHGGRHRRRCSALRRARFVRYERVGGATVSPETRLQRGSRAFETREAGSRRAGVFSRVVAAVLGKSEVAIRPCVGGGRAAGCLAQSQIIADLRASAYFWGTWRFFSQGSETDRIFK